MLRFALLFKRELQAFTKVSLEPEAVGISAELSVGKID